MAKSLLNNANEDSRSLRDANGRTMQIQGRARTWVDSAFAVNLPKGVTVRETDTAMPAAVSSADARPETA